MRPFFQPFDVYVERQVGADYRRPRRGGPLTPQQEWVEEMRQQGREARLKAAGCDAAPLDEPWQ